jgi:hypothetical protein
MNINKKFMQSPMDISIEEIKKAFPAEIAVYHADWSVKEVVDQFLENNKNIDKREEINDQYELIKLQFENYPEALTLIERIHDIYLDRCNKEKRFEERSIVTVDEILATLDPQKRKALQDRESALHYVSILVDLVHLEEGHAAMMSVIKDDFASNRLLIETMQEIPSKIDLIRSKREKSARSINNQMRNLNIDHGETSKVTGGPAPGGASSASKKAKLNSSKTEEEAKVYVKFILDQIPSSDRSEIENPARRDLLQTLEQLSMNEDLESSDWDTVCSVVQVLHDDKKVLDAMQKAFKTILEERKHFSASLNQTKGKEAEREQLGAIPQTKSSQVKEGVKPIKDDQKALLDRYERALKSQREQLVMAIPGSEYIIHNVRGDGACGLFSSALLCCYQVAALWGGATIQERHQMEEKNLVEEYGLSLLSITNAFEKGEIDQVANKPILDIIFTLFQRLNSSTYFPYDATELKIYFLTHQKLMEEEWIPSEGRDHGNVDFRTYQEKEIIPQKIETGIYYVPGHFKTILPKKYLEVIKSCPISLEFFLHLIKIDGLWHPDFY